MGEEKNGSSDWLPTIQLCNYLQCQIRRYVVNCDQHTVINTAAETDQKISRTRALSGYRTVLKLLFRLLG